VPLPNELSNEGRPDEAGGPDGKNGHGNWGYVNRDA
jgi:hypothetical protein